MTEDNLKALLAKVSRMFIEFEDEHGVILGSSVHLRSEGLFEDYTFDGEKFTQKENYEENRNHRKD